MNRLVDFARRIWISIQLSSPKVLRGLFPLLHEAKEIVRLLVKPYLPVYRLEGQGHDGPLSVVFAGREFVKPFLKERLFVEEPLERHAGRIAFWRRRELANLSADMVIVASATHVIRRLPRENVIVIPESVTLVLDVRGSWDDVLGRFRKTVRRNALRQIRKLGYAYDVSHDARDFEEFYDEMYLPTVAVRHEELPLPMDREEARQYFRRGWLFRVQREGRWVSGGVSHRDGDMLMLDIIGVRGGDMQLIEDGAMSARRYAAIEWAHHNGFQYVNFLSSGPYLSSGQFQSKRKWGTTVIVPPRLHRQVWIKIGRKSPAVARFLKDNPLIVIDHAGHLHGLVVVDDVRTVTAAMQAEWQKKYATPGLRNLLMCSIDDLVDASTTQPGAERAVPITLQAGLEKG
jgi:hypothetical protein